MSYLEIAYKALAGQQGQADGSVTESPPSAPPESRSTYITDSDELRRVAERLAQASVIGLDLETHSTFPDGALDPHLGVIRLVTLAVEETDADTGQVTPASFLIDAGACEDWPEVIGRILADATIVKVAHNGKFDLKFLMARGLLVANVFDTMLAAQLLDGGQHLKERGYFKLGTVVQRHLGQPLDKSQQTSNW